MRYIELTKDKFAIVDDADFEWLSQWKWYAHASYRKYYAARRDKNGQFIYMHRLITDAPNNLQIDHKNGNGLDNSRSNLRICTRSQNQANKIQTNQKSSIYKGVTWYKNYSKWMAQIHVQGKRKFIGYFSTEMEAAKAYDLKAKELFGEFAKLNMPKT